jgi:hypothetical protein
MENEKRELFSKGHFTDLLRQLLFTYGHSDPTKQVIQKEFTALKNKIFIYEKKFLFSEFCFYLRNRHNFFVDKK